MYRYRELPGLLILNYVSIVEIWIYVGDKLINILNYRMATAQGFIWKITISSHRYCPLRQFVLYIFMTTFFVLLILLFISQLRIEAYDLGLPTPLSSDLDLTIYVQNVDNYRPRFPNKHIRINFTENAPNNGVYLPSVIERDEIDRGDEPILPVCYYIVDGDEDNVFELQTNTHRYCDI